MATSHSDSEGDTSREEPVGLVIGKRVTCVSTLYEASLYNVSLNYRLGNNICS